MSEPFSLGAGLAVFGAFGTVSAAIIKLVPSRNGNGKKVDGDYVGEKLCGSRMKPVYEDIKEIKRDVKKILEKLMED